MTSAPALRRAAEAAGLSESYLPAWLRKLLTAWFGADRTEFVQRSLRSPDAVMRPASLAAMKACDLSSARTLVKRMVDQRWEITCESFAVGMDGAGRAVYRIAAEGHTMTFAVRAGSWDGHEKQGRRMEKTCDLQATLLFGHADKALIAREMDQLSIESWAGRTDSRCLGWSAANRSQRTFEGVVESLAAGRQPDDDIIIAGGGYLLRNAGFFGNGRNGTMSWLAIPESHALSTPYHVDIFSLYLWRIVGLDYAEALAVVRGGAQAAKLNPAIKRYIGVGNSSGLGMTCAVVRWPQWVGTWCVLRETCLAFAKTATPEDVAQRRELLFGRLQRAARYFRTISNPDLRFTPHDVLADHLDGLIRNFDKLVAPSLQGAAGGGWFRLCEAAEGTGCQEVAETVNALLIDLYPEITSRVAGVMPGAMRRVRDLVPEMSVAVLRTLLERNYAWALAVDQSRPGARQHFWYHSEDLGEQRRGERGIDPGEEFETFVDVVGAVQRCAEDLRAWRDDHAVAAFVLAHPEHVYIASRIQFTAEEPYAEIRGNLIDADFLPIMAIRFLFSMFGFESGSSVSNAWVRGVLLQGSPLPEDLAAGRSSDWYMPLPTKPTG